MRHANVRMFIPGTGMESGELRWRNLAIPYIKALIEAKLEPLLLAVPFVSLDKYDPLFELRDYFYGRLDMPYVNVVFGLHPISTVNVLTGLKKMQALTDGKRGLPIATDDLEEPTEVANLERLWTNGVRNVAVVAGWPRKLEPSEVKVLEKYDFAFVPTIEDLDTVWEQTDVVCHGPPAVFAQAVAKLLAGLDVWDILRSIQ